MPKEILVLDIETTGFLDQGGKIVEIGIVKLDLDSGEVTSVYDSLIKEDGLNASHTRGKFGWIFQNSNLKFEEVMEAPSLDSQKAVIQDLLDRYRVTAYNKAFDFGFLKDRGFQVKELECPMHLSTPIVKLPSPYNRGFKWPKVEEAWDFFFGKTGYIEAHRGLDDAAHEAKIVHKLYQMGKFPYTESLFD